jgi:hypothetical protein
MYVVGRMPKAEKESDDGERSGAEGIHERSKNTEGREEKPKLPYAKKEVDFPKTTRK